MASTKRESRIRRWSNEEIKQFAMILVNEEGSLLFQLERKALKKSSNKQIFANVKKIMDERLSDDEVVEKIKSEIGERKFKAQPKIETSIGKLRIKYKWMKDQRKKLCSRIDSGRAKPEWLQIIDPVLDQTHADLLRGRGKECDVDVSADDSKSSDNEEESVLDSGYSDLPTFCALKSENRDTSIAWDEENESDSSSTDAELISEGTGSKSTANEGPKETDVSNRVRKSGVAEKETTSPVKITSRKRKAKVKSQEQALRDLSENIQKMNESIDKRFASMINEEKKRDEAFMKFHEKQCELNRQHELRMMEMMMKFVQPPPHVAYNVSTGETVPVQAYYAEPSGENNSSAVRNANQGRCCGHASNAAH